MAHFRLMYFVAGVVAMDLLAFDHSLPATSNCFDYFFFLDTCIDLVMMRNDTHIKNKNKTKKVMA